MLSSVDNALRVIDHLADRGACGVSEIGRALDLTVGTVHRLVTTLVGAGYVTQNPADRRYGLSSKIPDLARRMRPATGIVSTARPHLERLMSLSGETVNLGILREDSVLYVDRVVTDQLLAISVKVGSRVPAYCTGMGRALLACASETTREDYLRRLTSISDGCVQIPPAPEELRRILAKVATRGYAEEDAAFVAEIACFAAPVFDYRDRAVAAVSIAGPRSRIRARKNDLIPLVRAAAGEITKALEPLRDELDL